MCSCVSYERSKYHITITYQNVCSMKYLFFNFFFVQVWPIFLLYCLGMPETKRRFVVISNFSVANQFYDQVRNTKPRFYNEPNIDVNTKKQICIDITRSHAFRKYRAYLIENYYHPTRGIRIRMRNESCLGYTPRFDEMAFACLIREYVYCRVKTFFISEEYNLYANLSGPSRENKYVAGRFIFKRRKAHWRSYFLYGLAELAGNAFSSPDHDIESLYLRRRRDYGIPWEAEDDALCSLSIAEKRRVCVAVFASDYFERRVVLSKNNLTTCKLTKISFQTEYGKEKAKKQFYKTERMLDCDDFRYEHRMATKIDYLLSHAYESDQIFVFLRNRRTGEVFPEILITDVRLTFIPPSSSDPRVSNYTFEDSEEKFAIDPVPPPFVPFTFGVRSTP